MTYPAKELIKKRKSVRTFDGRSLSAEHLKTLVILGEEKYLAAKVKRVPRYEIALGYSFEEACLYALSLGIGTVMLAASLNRSAFEKAINVGADEVMPVASPLGYPAEKKSMREKLMRKGIKADERLPFEQLFFEGDFSRPLAESNTFAEALSMARLAPSAANKQPWRAVVIGDTVHFYEYKTMKDSPLGDIQKVDMGIALCHFDLTMQENGHTGAFVFEDPGLEVPEYVHYIVTYVRAE